MSLSPPNRPLPRARARAVLLCACLGLAPGVGWACEPLDPERVQEDRPIRVAPNGSFVDAAEDDIWYGLTGGPVRDIGGGRVGQIIDLSEDCMVRQRLLFADCTTREAILIWGLRHPDGGAWWTERTGPFNWPISESTRALQAPNGPLALTPDTTVDDIHDVAVREDITVIVKVPELMATEAEHNRLDPFLGCQIFYPDLPGANP